MMQITFRIKSALIISLTLLGMLLFGLIFVFFPLGLIASMIIPLSEMLVYTIFSKIPGILSSLASSTLLSIIKLYVLIIFFRLIMHSIYFYLHQYDYDGFDRSYSNYNQPRLWSFQFLLSFSMFCLVGWGLWWCLLSGLNFMLDEYEIVWWLVELGVAVSLFLIMQILFVRAHGDFCPFAKKTLIQNQMSKAKLLDN